MGSGRGTRGEPRKEGVYRQVMEGGSAGTVVMWEGEWVEGGRVMAGQGQTKSSTLARDESGMEVEEEGGGVGGRWGREVMGGSYCPARISACLCNSL